MPPHHRRRGRRKTGWLALPRWARLGIVITSLIVVLAGIGAAVGDKEADRTVTEAPPSSTSASTTTLSLAVPADMLNPAVTQATIQDTVCKTGYTDSIRPASTETSALKTAQIPAYGYADSDPAKYQHDHVIALALGGAAEAPVNLFPEPLAGALGSDSLERDLHSQLCTGRIDLAAAQAQLLAAKVANGYDRAKSESGARALVTTTAPTVATTAAPATTAPRTTAASPTTGSANVYFENCSQARAAGAAPIYRGSPGYRPALDRDDDGIACDT